MSRLPAKDGYRRFRIQIKRPGEDWEEYGEEFAFRKATAVNLFKGATRIIESDGILKRYPKGTKVRALEDHDKESR